MTRILLSEDEPVLARNIASAFAKSGTEVVHAASAAETRRQLAQRKYDLVIADISLGDGDGLDAIGGAGESLRGTPIIVMTGQDSIANRSRAEDLSVSAFLSKPFALSRLREIAGALTDDTATGRSARKGPTVVMYSHDTIGLGHMRRNSTIAKELVRQIPGVSVLMLVGCPSGLVFETAPGIDYVKLPSLSKVGRSAYLPNSLRIDTKTALAVRRSIVEGVLDSIRPDIFLVDHEPSGAMGELAPILERLKSNNRVRTVLGLRDILDEPNRVRKNWKANGTDKIIAQAYDHVLVYGDPSFYPSVSAYGLDDLKPDMTTYCGVVTSVSGQDRLLPNHSPREVLVSGGGGRDGYPLIEAALFAARSIPVRRRPRMTVVLGPLMDPELRQEAHHLGAVENVEVLDQVHDMPERLRRSDLFISMTGYNSINEAIATGCPIVTVPRLGPSAEQRLRAEALEAARLARYLRREELSPASLATLLTKGVPQLRARGFNAHGASCAASVLKGLCAAVDAETPEAVNA